MAAAKPARGEAREILLDTAEELFANQGVEAVSLRQINAAAGVSAGVLHYHFGSRDVLVGELITRSMSKLAADRESRLEALLAHPDVAVNQVVAAMIEPLAEMARDAEAGGARYVRFLSRLYNDRSPILDEVSTHYRSVNQLYLKLLRRALPMVDSANLNLRVTAANYLMLQLLADMACNSRVWSTLTATGVSTGAQVERLIEFISAGLSAPTNEASP